MLTKSVGSNPNIKKNFKQCFELDKSNFEFTLSTKTELKTPPKSPKFEPVWPEMGQIQAQLCKN